MLDSDPQTTGAKRALALGGRFDRRSLAGLGLITCEGEGGSETTGHAEGGGNNGETKGSARLVGRVQQGTHGQLLIWAARFWRFLAVRCYCPNFALIIDEELFWFPMKRF
jgi:hypothetical protein